MGVTVANPPSTNRWGTYIDIDEAWDFLELHGEPTEPRRKKIKRYIDSCCTFAQNRTNRPLGPTVFRERHDGWSGEYVMLSYSPFLELIECREWQSSGGFITLPESTPENPIEGLQLSITSRAMRTFAGYSWPRPFFPGSRNVEFIYLAGFNPVPPDIWLATMELIVWQWRNSEQATRTWALPGTDWTTEGGNSLWPGVPNRVGEVFDSYWVPSIG